MAYNLAVPGQQSEFELRAIELAASLVPQHGRAVEIGSLFGRSSWAWAKSIPASARLLCIDPWEPGPGSQPLEQRYGVAYSIDTFRRHLADCDNLDILQGYSPEIAKDWSDPIDLFFEDAVHRNPVFEQNLNFWSRVLKPTGVACGDDYRPRYPDIVNGVAKLAKRLGRSIITVDFFWCLLPNAEDVPEAREVERQLKALSKEAFEANRASPPVIIAEPLSVFRRVQIGADRPVRVRVVSFYVDNWSPGGDSKVVFGVRLFDEPKADAPVVAQELITIDQTVVYPDQPDVIELKLPTKGLQPKKYYAMYGVLDGETGAFMSERRGVPVFVEYEFHR